MSDDPKHLIKNNKNNKGNRKPYFTIHGKYSEWLQGRCRICHRFLNRYQYDLCAKHQYERNEIQDKRDLKKFRNSENGKISAKLSEEKRRFNLDRLFYLKTRSYVVWNIEKLNIGDIF